MRKRLLGIGGDRKLEGLRRLATLSEPVGVIRLVDAAVDIRLGQQQWEAARPDRLLGDDALADIRAFRDVVHHLEEGFLHDLLEAVEGPTTDEQYVGRVDLDEVLVGMLSAT